MIMRQDKKKNASGNWDNVSSLDSVLMMAVAYRLQRYSVLTTKLERSVNLQWRSQLWGTINPYYHFNRRWKLIQVLIAKSNPRCYLSEQTHKFSLHHGAIVCLWLIMLNGLTDNVLICHFRTAHFSTSWLLYIFRWRDKTVETFSACSWPS